MKILELTLAAAISLTSAAAHAVGTYTYSFSFLSVDNGNAVGLATDAGRNVYVANSNNNTVQIFKKDGTYLRTIRDSRYYGLNTPVTLAVGADDRVHVYSFNGNDIQTYDREGTLLNEFTRDGSSFFDLRISSQLSVDTKGDVFVPIFGEGAIDVYDKDGYFLRSFGDGHLYYPLGLAHDLQGNVLVYDTRGGEGSLGRILTFSSEGKLLSSFSNLRSDGDALAVDKEGNILLATTWSVDRYSPTGRFIDSIYFNGVMLSGGIAVDADNRLLVTARDLSRGQVHVFTSSVPELSSWMLFIVGLGLIPLVRRRLR